MNQTRLTRAMIAGVSALGTGLLVALPGMAPASAATHIGTIRPGHVIWNAVHSQVSLGQADSAALASSTFTQYKSTVTVGTKSYTYVIAGKNPAKQVTNPASTISVDLVPLVMKFSNGDTWDPTKIDSCDSGASALTRTQNSPVFKSHSYTWDGQSVGTFQVTDAFQRAEFWKYAQPSGINPTFGVKFSVSTHSPITVNVPSTQAASAPISCGNGLIGAANINWLDPYLQSTVIPSLGIGPATVPVFLLHNFVEFVGTTSQCCVLGYHNAYSTGAGIQTYALSMYDNSGFFGTASRDISALSHEMGEWQNDPYTNNPTPAWGHIGQVTGCQSNLEVGDPLSGTTFKVSMNSFTYHPQELAFFSWFYHQKTTLGLPNWYSDQGTFKTYAATCT